MPTLEPQIIYETKDFLAINKPAGLMVHRARSARRMAHGAWRMDDEQPTLTDWLVKKYPEVKSVGDPSTGSGQVVYERPGIVHRLDKDTSGVMLVAKNQEYFEYLKSLFQNHQVKKTYYAVVLGVPKNKEGRIDSPIGIRNGTLKRSVRSTKMQKEAVTEYKVLKIFDPSPLAPNPSSLLQVHPLTGRTHQIRVHLASIGHPIVGDRLYGRKSALVASAYPRLMLHASSIEFPDKNGSVIRIESELPGEFGDKW